MPPPTHAQRDNMPEPITFFEALAAMRAGARVVGIPDANSKDRCVYRISGGVLFYRSAGNVWSVSRLDINAGMNMQWFRLESSG